MDPLLILPLALAGLLVGATGTWSPCGFSMIETIGPAGHRGGRSTTLAACATFAPAAVIGGAITFGALALAGEALGGGSAFALAVAALVATAAAFAEARGIPIVPQVRRQLPVGWRARLPMPLAAAGYGVLLGLGFTTFILSYGVWALMGIALAIGEPLVGLILGVAFGVGRAVPIVVLAPIADREAGRRACDAMAMRPALYRRARLGDAAALTLLAVALAGAAGAQAARKEAPKAADPDASGRAAIVFERNNGEGILQRRDGSLKRLAGSDPAIGETWIAVIQGQRISILARRGLTEVGAFRARGADGLAVGDRWLAYRQRRRGGDTLRAVELSKRGVPGKPRKVARVGSPSQISRPAVDGSKLIAAVSKRRRSKLVRFRLRRGKKIRRSSLISRRNAAITGPSIAGRRIAYVHTNKRRQTVRVRGLGGNRGRVVYRRRKAPPTVWTTAIAGRRVWVTMVQRNGRSKLISVRR